MNLYFRFFFNILKNILFRKPMHMSEDSIVSLRVLPNDLDLNMHMNNGRFLTIMDIGRTDFTIRLGLDKIVVKHKLGAVAAAVNITFLKALNPFAKYRLHTRVLSWDDLWFYMEQQFIKDGMIYAHAIVKVTFLKKGKKISPDFVISKLEEKTQIARPEMPEYLKELIHGEKIMVDNLREHNRTIRNL